MKTEKWLADKLLACMAEAMQEQPEELGREWQEYAAAIAECTLVWNKEYNAGVGRLARAVVNLP